MRALLLASFLVSTTAVAQTYAPPPPVPPPAPAPLMAPADGPGNGMQLELGLLQTGGVLNLLTDVFSTNTGVGGNAGAFATPQPSLSVGYQWDQNALLLGLGLAAASGPTFLFGIGPTYRRYFTPLRTGAFSGFGEGTIAFEILAPNAGPSSFGIGFDGGLGGEWLFVKNFALFAKATLGYTHIGLPGGLNFDGIGLAGTAGLTLHL
ncbi:MAG TPA: hypothetical protein VMB50_18365 [Myxococcales bacterium]|nr:hypothetical protein [Myxococcales bacterium]